MDTFKDTLVETPDYTDADVIRTRAKLESMRAQNPELSGIDVLLKDGNDKFMMGFAHLAKKASSLSVKRVDEKVEERNKLMSFIADFKKACDIAGLPKAKVDFILDNTQFVPWRDKNVHLGQLSHFEPLARTVTWLKKEQHTKPLLVLCAPTGSGKTVAACFATMHAVSQDIKIGMRRFMSFTQYNNWVANYNHDEERARFEACRFIAIDELRPIEDMGVRRPAALASALLDMIDVRTNSGHKTIIATTMPAAKLRVSFSDELIRRFDEYGIIYDMGAKGEALATMPRRPAKAAVHHGVRPQSYAPPIGREPGSDG